MLAKNRVIVNEKVGH